jgi:hypothetical protein
VSRFDELCQANNRYQTERNDYRDRSIEALAKIISGFATYIEAPRESIKYLPSMGCDDSVSYSPQGAVRYEENGWWIAYVSLIRPTVHCAFCFRLRNEVDRYKVRIGDSEKVHDLAALEPGIMNPIWEEAFLRSKEYLTNANRRFVDETGDAKESRRIGFVIEDAPST